MNLKPLAPIWLASWAALAPVGLLKMGGYDLPFDRQIMGAALFTLPLSGPAAFAAIIAIYIRRHTSDGGWRLAAWLAVAATFWAGSSVLAMGAARQAPLDSDEHLKALRIGFICAWSAFVVMVDGVMYFAQRQLGLRRLAAALSAACGVIVVLVLVCVVMADGAVTPANLALIGSLGLMAVALPMFIGLAAIAAVRWIRSGFATDKPPPVDAAAAIDVRS